MGRGLESFNIKGERCTGTTYLQKLIEDNLHVPYIQDEDVGWKHGFLDLKVSGLGYSERFLTIVIFRNVFDWTRSFYKTPHHMEHTRDGRWIKEQQPTFSEFIRREVKQVGRFGNDLPYERHPFHLTRAKNILELRKWKIENFLNLKNALKHTYYVRYEDLVEMPDVIVAEINSRWFGRKYNFKNWNNYKTESATFTRKSYFDLSPDDESYIIDNVDWDIEKQAGYFIPNKD